MRVLVLEHETQAADHLERGLQELGHTTVRCVPEADREGRCMVMREGGACALDAAPIDVALVVTRGPSGSAPVVAGVACATRDGVPVVNVGSGESVSDVESSLHDAQDHVIGLERSARAELARSIERVGGDPTGADVTVSRSSGRTKVALTAPGLDKQHLGMAAVRVLGVVRDPAGRSRTVDVTAHGDADPVPPSVT